MNRLIVIAIVFLFAGQVTHSQIPTVSVGGIPIALPAPDGFFRYDGKSVKVDRFEQSFLDKNGRFLAMFGSEEVLADVLSEHIPKPGRRFSAQADTNLEVLAITPTYFAELKPEIRKSFATNPEILSEAVKELESGAASALPQFGILGKLKIGELISLGVFDETKESLCFSFLAKAKISEKAGSNITITTNCVVNVKEKLIFLVADRKSVV